MPSIAEFFHQTVDGVFAVDGNQRITFWNSACGQLLGIPAEEAIGRPCDDVLAGRTLVGDRFCEKECCVSRVIDGGEGPKTFKLQLRGANGKTLKLSVSIILVPSKGDERWTCVHLLHRDHAESTIEDLVPQPEAPSGSNGGGRARGGNGTVSPMTPRQQEILELLAEGKSATVISHLLGIRLVTVRNHIQHIQAKLGVHSQAETVAYAYRHNLI
ncbi:MAG: LuxR C-terminal-related transcriptional regulator [Alphaproteobacteria bacterium]|jgi:PAS domain S-box-containing protein|nr:LuxR C-terminal-related transcriptional regulator [Alphaproteobacteria bacterium]